MKHHKYLIFKRREVRIPRRIFLDSSLCRAGDGPRKAPTKFSGAMCVFLAFLPVFFSLQSCGVAVVGTGVATGATVAYDRRTTGVFVDDQVIELKALNNLRSDKDMWRQSHIRPVSFNNIVLLAGEVPNDFLRERAAGLVRKIPEIRYIHNELAVAAPSSVLARGGDSVVTGKVKAGLAADKEIRVMQIKVVTVRGIVYLMGLVTRQEADRATDVARRVAGVQRVIRLFEYM